jgi:hypothetical protein
MDFNSPYCPGRAGKKVLNNSTWVHSTSEFAMNIEFDEVVALDVPDDALEMAAGVQQGGPNWEYRNSCI